MFTVAAVCFCLAATGCKKYDNSIPNWPWNDPDDNPEPEPEFVDPNPEVVALGWINVMDAYGTLPEHISVYRSPETLEGQKAVAYIAVEDLSKASFGVWGISDPKLSGSEDDLKTPSDVYKDKNYPAIVVNGGYFYSDSGTNYASSLAVSEGTLLSPNINYASQDWVTIYYPTRAAFVEHKDGSIEACWTYFANSGHFMYQSPAENSWEEDPLDVPSATFPSEGAEFEAVNGIGGGPVLLKGGAVKNTGAEELFSETTDVGYGISNPRTAIGKTDGGKLVLFVCEGRQMTDGVAGLTTAEVADILKSLGCTEAINLDGGGSSCMLVNGKETIKVSDGSQRKVGSCVYLN